MTVLRWDESAWAVPEVPLVSAAMSLGGSTSEVDEFPRKWLRLNQLMQKKQAHIVYVRPQRRLIGVNPHIMR